MIDQYIITQLKELVDSVDVTAFPYQKGNSIRIAHIVIRKSNHGYLIYDCKENKRITETYSKTAAVAWARAVIKDTGNLQEIKKLDDIIAKNHTDSLFYKNTIENTENEIKRETAEFRLDISLSKTKQAKANLMRFLFV
tara:strand:- start:778 stop:1194 length:417 start_codon:yes stop_codon:yes gene_type:complete